MENWLYVNGYFQLTARIKRTVESKEVRYKSRGNGEREREKGSKRTKTDSK